MGSDDQGSLNLHPFETVSTTNPSAQAFAEILADDIVFHSPVFVHPVSGRAFVAKLLETVHGIFGRPRYTLRLTEGSNTVLVFNVNVEGEKLEVAVVLHDDHDLIQEITVLMRPLPVVRRFAEKGMARLGLTEADDVPSAGGKGDPASVPSSADA